MPRFNPRLVMFSSMGLELGLSVIVGLLLGSSLDRFFGTGPWMLIIFTASGIAAGYRSVYRLLKRLQHARRVRALGADRHYAHLDALEDGPVGADGLQLRVLRSWYSIAAVA